MPNDFHISGRTYSVSVWVAVCKLLLSVLSFTCSLYGCFARDLIGTGKLAIEGCRGQLD